jgi:hypothetical protein
MNRIVRWSTIVLVIGLAGCASPPQAEIDAAKAAVSAAESAEASKYAADAWNAANAAMDAANNELATQDAKMGLTRSYEEAKKLLADASAKASQAQEAAVAGKAQAKTDAETTLQGAKDALQQATTVLTELEGSRRKPKGFTADLTALRGSLDGLYAQVGEVESGIAAEDFLGAKAKAEALKSQADTLLADLQGAQAKLAGG